MDILELNRKAWDAIGARTASPYINNPAYQKLFERFCSSLKKNAKVLDVGCGPGIPVTKALVDKGFQVTALDLSEQMLSLVEKNVPEAKTLLLSATDIDEKQEYDGIVSSYSLLCLDPPRFKKALKRIARALKSKGLFFLALNEPTSPPEEGYEHIERILGQEMYTRGYTEEEIQEMLPKSLNIIETARDVVTSEAYGTEHSLILLMRKT